MNNEDILTKAMEKAVYEDVEETIKFHNMVMGKRYYEIIFSQRFAKAFWGEGVYEPDGVKIDNCPCGREDEHEGKEEHRKAYLQVWQYHLQQMVLEEEPLKYIEKFI